MSVLATGMIVIILEFEFYAKLLMGKLIIFWANNV